MKVDFSKNSKARKITIIAFSVIIVFLSAFSSLPVFASQSVTNFNMLTAYTISDYIMPFDSSDNFEKFGVSENSSLAEWYLKMLNKGDWSITGDIQNPVDYPHFFISCYTRKPVNDQITVVRFFQMPEDSFVLFLNQGYYVMIPNITSDYRGYTFEMDNENTPYFHSYYNDRRGDTKRFGDISYQAMYVSGYNSGTIGNVINSDVPYYYMDVDYLVDVPANNPAFDEDDNGNQSSDFGGISDSDIMDNNYLGENNYILMDASSLENGKWKIFLDWNQNQLSDLSKYQINATFDLSANVTFEGSGNYEEICIDTYNLTKVQSGVYILDKTFSTSKSISVADAGYYTFDFSALNDGLKSGGKTVLPLVQLVDNTRSAAGADDDVKSGTSNLVSDLFSGSYAGFRIPLFQSHNDVKVNTLNYTCTVDVINTDTGKEES